MTNTQKLLETYLDCLDLTYTLKVSQEGSSLIFTIIVPKINNEKIGILKGRMGQNILNLKRILKIVASLENYVPLVIIVLGD